MADLSLADALTEPPPEIEGEIKRDFIATLEAEAYDDVVGETVGKTDYIPLLDVDENTGNSESKKKPCSDASQIEGTPSPKPAVLANGDHGMEGNDTTGSPTEFLEEKIAYQGYQNNQNWPESTNFCFQSEQVVNPMQIDPFKMHQDDDLGDLLSFPSAPATASAFIQQNDPLKDSYGLFPYDTFASAGVVPKVCPVEASNSPHVGVFISPEATQPLQPTAEPVEKIEMVSVEEKASADALEIMMGLKAADMVPSRETEVALAKDTAPITEPKVALAKDKEQPTKDNVAFTKDMESSNESVMFAVKDTVLPIETEETPGKDGTLFQETDRSPLIKLDLVPAESMESLSEMEMALAKDVVSSTEISSAKELALSSESEVALVKDVAPSPESEVALVKDMAPSPESEVALVKDLAPFPETEVALVKDMALLPKTEMTLAKDVVPPSETEVPVKDMEVVRSQGEIKEDSQLHSTQKKGCSAAPTSMISPEPVTATSQKFNLPTDEVPALEKLEQKKPFSSQPSELSFETSGTLPTQARQVCRPRDHRTARPRPARVPPELLGGSSQKTLNPGPGPCSLSELGWVSGSSSCGEPGNQRKPFHVDFLEPQRDLDRETWDVESTAMMMKKKKKKPKQKRYSQPRAGGPWDDVNAKEPKGHPFVADLQKSGVLPNQSATVGTECGLASRENLKKKCEINSISAKLPAKSSVSESPSVPWCPLEERLKAAVNSQPQWSVEAEVKGNKSGLQSQDRKSLQQGKCKPQTAVHTETPGAEGQAVGSMKLKGPLIEVSPPKVEIPLKVRPQEGCFPVLDPEAVGEVLKPIAAKELPNLIPILTVGNSLENGVKEGSNKRKMTKPQTDKEFSEGAEDIKELNKEPFPKQRQEMSILASEQPQDKVQVPEPGNEPFKRMAGDGKSRKGKGSSGKARASSGKVRARAELPVLLDSQEDGRAGLTPSEPTPKTERMTAGDTSQELGLDSSKLQGISADLPEAVIMEEPKETTDSSVASTLQTLIPQGTGSGVTQTFSATAERGAMAIDQGASNQSKEGRCPWVDLEAAPWISEKPRKRSSEGKTKKFKTNYSTQPARVESKEEILSQPFVGKGGSAGGTPHPDRALGLAFPISPEPLFSQTMNTPAVVVTDRKGRSVEVNSFELGAVSINETDTVKDSAVSEAATQGTDGSFQDQIQGAGLVPSVLPEEHKTDAAKGHTAVADKPSKWSSDGKSKKIKNNLPEKHVLGSETDATKRHVSMEAIGDHRIEGMGYVDENRNITFTCPRTLPEVMHKSAPLKALDLTAYEKLPTPAPQLVKEGDSSLYTLAESRQETAPAQISKPSGIDNCSKDVVPDQDRSTAPAAVVPFPHTGCILANFTAAIETVKGPGDNHLKNEGELADLMKNKPEVDGGTLAGESKSVPSCASKHSVEKSLELAKEHFSGAPVEGQSPPGEPEA